MSKQDQHRPEQHTPERTRSSMAQTFKYAFEGIGYTIRSQRNMKVHLIVATFALAASALLQLTVSEWAVIVILIGLAFMGEMLNTAIEAIVDLVSPEFHPLAKIAKDVGAGMVLILAIVSVVGGTLIYSSALLRLVG